MLQFTRHKLVRVTAAGPGRLRVSGTLQDDLYGLAMDVELDERELKILAISGSWLYHTTPECPRAIPQLQRAVGLRAEPGFEEAIKKIVGRAACRHFANLVIECLKAARDAGREEQETVAAAETAPADAPGATPATRRAGLGKLPAARPGRTLIDLHVHTVEASPCASAPVDTLIREAKALGLDAVCLTDHHRRWSAEDLKRLSREHDFLVLGGTEITTDQGDVLVFGWYGDPSNVVRLADLFPRVDAAGGCIVAAHPFRGFLVVGPDQVGLTVDRAARRPLFSGVHAVEVLNTKVTPRENAVAREVAGLLGLPAVGGSDAHATGEVGTYATCIAERVETETELAAALRRGACSPQAVRPETPNEAVS